MGTSRYGVLKKQTGVSGDHPTSSGGVNWFASQFPPLFSVGLLPVALKLE